MPLRLVTAPDGVVDRTDRALWLTSGFDLPFFAGQYRVYANDGAGGPVDYATPIATTAALTYQPTALSASSDWTFAVRAFDVISGLEETNVDARLRVVVDAGRVDVTNLPAPPTATSATAQAAGAVRVDWHWSPGRGGGTPTGFHVYHGTPTVGYVTIRATVAYDGNSAYSTTFAGLTDGASYEFGVRAYNATGEEANVVVATATADATAPAVLDGLTATATFDA